MTADEAGKTPGQLADGSLHRGDIGDQAREVAKLLDDRGQGGQRYGQDDQIGFLNGGGDRVGRGEALGAGRLAGLRVGVVAGHMVAARVEGLEPGIYRYRPAQHALKLLKAGEFGKDLARAALRQGAISDAAANLVITGIYARTAGKYGPRAKRYVHIEVGHVGQNVYLQAEALGLGTVSIGAFHDDRVKKLLGVDEQPLYIMPIGRRWK